MAATVVGELSIRLVRDDEGHREYELTTLVETSDYADGPTTVSLCPGLPTPGSTWVLGNDFDTYAWCRPNMEVEQVVLNEPCNLWTVKQIFSTRPLSRCQDISVENPLTAPPKIGGSALKYLREKNTDKDGNAIVTSAGEIVHGEAVEVDDPRPTINITINSASANLGLYAQVLRNAPLNDAPLWGLPARCVKFADWTWEKNYYGICTAYYTHYLGFEIAWDTFDRWFPNIGNVYKDPGPPVRWLATHSNGIFQPMPLDAAGAMLGPGDTLIERKAQPLSASNLLLLGIPATL